jgi:hypothetical protein
VSSTGPTRISTVESAASVTAENLQAGCGARPYSAGRPAWPRPVQQNPMPSLSNIRAAAVRLKRQMRKRSTFRWAIERSDAYAEHWELATAQNFADRYPDRVRQVRYARDEHGTGSFRAFRVPRLGCDRSHRGTLGS